MSLLGFSFVLCKYEEVDQFRNHKFFFLKYLQDDSGSPDRFARALDFSLDYNAVSLYL